MRSVIAIILKNSILITLIIISLVFIFTQTIGFKEWNYIFITTGLLYVLAACYEVFQLSRTNSTAKKFIYFTDGFVAKRILKIISFTCFGVVLQISGSMIQYLSYLCFLIAFTEIILTIWRKLYRLNFVALDGNAIIISTNKLNTMYAKDVAKIEARHGITYFVNKNLASFTLRTDMMKERDAFAEALNEWVVKNDLQAVVQKG